MVSSLAHIWPRIDPWHHILSPEPYLLGVILENRAKKKKKKKQPIEKYREKRRSASTTG